MFIIVKTYNDEDIIEFNGIITYQRYYNEDTTYGVFGFVTTDDIPFYKQEEVDPFDENAQKSDNKFSVLSGNMQELSIGGKYTIKAIPRNNKTYGYQYEPIAIYAITPQTREEQMVFLKSIIPAYLASNLLDVYPNIVNDVIENKIQTIEYDKVKGVRELTWNRVKEKIIGNYLISDIIIMLKPLGVTYNMIKKLLDDEPNPSLLKKKIDENPYLLTKIKGLGFKRVDELALKVKPNLLKSRERLVAYIKYTLTEIGDADGHTWVSENILKDSISNNVPETLEHYEWLLTNKEFLHIKDGKIGLKYYYDIETDIYNRLIKQTEVNSSRIKLTDEQIDTAIKNAEDEQGYKYTKEQLEIIRDSLDRKVSFITGKAGTGKTSIMRGILKAYIENNYSVSSCALSAMAAKRIKEATNYPASTIHRTLGCQGINKFSFNKDNNIISDVIILDEASMVNASLFLHLLDAININTRIIISGDHKQLPPIGYGNVFSDLINIFDRKYVSELTKVMRQAEKSGILVDANLIRDNINPIIETIEPKIIHGELQDMFYMFRNSRDQLFNIAINTFLKTAEKEGLDNVIIVTPRRKDCKNSAFELNKEIQKRLLGDEKKEIVGYENSFKLGAKVMQIVNDYDNNVFNGEMGYITNIDKEKVNNKEVVYCTVTFCNTNEDNCKTVRYEKKDLVKLNLAYAVTTHKCQGSGIPTVIGIIDNTHFQLLDNCMLYTMLTRAKKRCLLLAEPQAFVSCIRTSHNARNTWLSKITNSI